MSKHYMFKTEDDAIEYFGDPEETDVTIWECDFCHQYSIIEAYERGGMSYTGGDDLYDDDGKNHGCVAACLDCEDTYKLHYK